ncbi:MAG: carboxymuconolactone decarboxylase family protein [Candidatus Rokubacteria bacterium]|nr:carboxymuconolactone decarboxylase family protein [Candidatus Rokubacteria bacterium]
MTNNLNSLADGVRCPLDFDGGDRRPLLPLVEPADAAPEVRAVFDDACTFYAMARPPGVLRAMANDPAFLRELWPAVRATFEPGALDRLTKEILALAASVTAKSDYGVDFHLREVRRLGLPEAGVLEVLQVTQMFNGFTKIADALRLAPDDFAPLLR